MGRMSAASDMDFYDEQEGRLHLVELTCEDCGETFDVPVIDAPPVGRPLCYVCTQQLEEQGRRETLRQWVETQRQERK